MAFAIGKIDVFDDGTETWTCYHERLDQYFCANEVADDKKVPALLALIGPKTYQILRDLAGPDLPKDKTFAQLCTLLSEHFSPKPLVIAERFRFYKRDQKADESVKDFNVSLRKLAEHCSFGVNLNDSLRDRFVCGLKNETIQKKLLTERDLTYDNAVKIAHAMESANKDVQELHGKHPTESVHKMKSNRKFSKHTAKPENKKQSQTSQTRQSHKSCKHCNRRNHAAGDCKFKNATCFSCRKKGHIVPACPVKNVHQLVDSSEEECLFSMKAETKTSESGKKTDKNCTNSRDSIWVKPKVNGKSLKMELDTGSGVSVMSKSDFSQLYPRKRLLPTTLKLRTYSGEEIKPEGVMKCKVEYDGQTKVLDMYIVENGNRPLMGREWLSVLRLDWSNIKALQTEKEKSKAEELKSKYKTVFSKDLGTVKGVKAHLKLKEGAEPKFVKARNVPFAMKPKIDKELEKLVADGVLEKVTHSDWGTPIVPVPKSKKDEIRICGDFKVTLNPVLDIDIYPLPKIEEIFGTLGGKKKFSKIDLKNAYLQIEVDDESKKLLTITTHKGLFRYNRLVFGVASAPAIFQRTIEQIMCGVPGVSIILDDMIITGDNDEAHLENLERVLQRLEEYNLRVNPDKCQFFRDKLEFCGHEVDENGLHKTEEKKRAVINAKIENVSQLRSFLGLVQYYNRFLENLSEVLYPLHQLLRKDVKWNWTKECEKAVETVKDMVTSDLVLMNYDPSLPLLLACDASSYGLGAVLSHKLPDGSDRPIAYASRSLNDAEKNYSQIDKEATALVWGVKKFNTYLYGNTFTLITDHKPLLSILHPRKGLSSTTGARLQRYSLFLAGYVYEIQYKNTKAHGNCDSLSRVPLQETEVMHLDATDVYLNSIIDTLPVTCQQIATATRNDNILSKVFEIVATGLKGIDTSAELKPYLNRHRDLSLHQGCLMWGSRVVVPDTLQKQVLNELHDGHIGIVKMKSVARSYVWWPKLDTDLEELTKHCSGCMANKPSPPEAPIHPWEFPKKPWSRVHVDFAGPFQGYMYLVIVDAYSKWPIVKVMKKTTASHTIEVIRAVFADCGVCDELVSDNGPQFVSEEFRHFLKMNGVKHIRSAPYHPRTNGLAEKFVQTLKQALKAAKNDSGTIQTKVSKFLLQYRNAEHATTKESPAKLFLGRSLTTRLDKVRPCLQKRVEGEQSKTVRSTRDRQFEVGESVAVRDYRGGHDKWSSGVIHAKSGPVSYQVEIAPGVMWRRHTDQIRASSDNVPAQRPINPVFGQASPVAESVDCRQPATVTGADQQATPPQPVPETVATSSPKRAPDLPASHRFPERAPELPTSRRYPERIRKKPEKLDL